MSSADRCCDAAVLAAGQGTRMCASARAPKPLARVLGQPLIEHVLRALAEGGVRRAAVAVRAEHPALAAYLRDRPQPVETVVVARDTEGGKDSLLGLERHLSEGFVLCTADGLFPAQELPEFVQWAKAAEAVLTLGVVPRAPESTGDVGVILSDRRVVALGKHLRRSAWVAEGPMWCTRQIFDQRVTRASQDVSSLSASHARLIELGLPVQAYPFSWAMDVDNTRDLGRAEAHLRALTS